MALITIRDITLAFGGPPLFDGISLQIEPGDRLCVDTALLRRVYALIVIEYAIRRAHLAGITVS